VERMTASVGQVERQQSFTVNQWWDCPQRPMCWEACTQAKWCLGAHEERAACGSLREGDNPGKTGPG
jgi:hypothetical protein